MTKAKTRKVQFGDRLESAKISLDPTEKFRVLTLEFSRHGRSENQPIRFGDYLNQGCFSESILQKYVGLTCYSYLDNGEAVFIEFLGISTTLIIPYE